MTIRTYKVTLDSKNSIAPEPVFLRQGDKTGAVVIDATLMDNGSPVSLDSLTPMFKANTADGQAVIADSTGFNVLDSANGEFTYQVPNALSSVPGKITTAYFSLSDAHGSESTFDVAFIIKKAVDITKPQAEDYITIIDGTINSLQEKIDAMNTDIQTVLNAYNQGDFYNKSETDSKDGATLSSAKKYADSGDSNVLYNAKNYTDNSLSGIVALPETFADLAAIKSKYPNGANGVMVAADNGHKYIWANNVWTDAGVYQAVGIADGSITGAKIADNTIQDNNVSTINLRSVVDSYAYIGSATVWNPSTNASIIIDKTNVTYIKSKDSLSNSGLQFPVTLPNVPMENQSVYIHFNYQTVDAAEMGEGIEVYLSHPGGALINKSYFNGPKAGAAVNIEIPTTDFTKLQIGNKFNVLVVTHGGAGTLEVDTLRVNFSAIDDLLSDSINRIYNITDDQVKDLNTAKISNSLVQLTDFKQWSTNDKTNLIIKNNVLTYNHQQTGNDGIMVYVPYIGSNDLYCAFSLSATSPVDVYVMYANGQLIPQSGRGTSSNQNLTQRVIKYSETELKQWGITNGLRILFAIHEQNKQFSLANLNISTTNGDQTMSETLNNILSGNPLRQIEQVGQIVDDQAITDYTQATINGLNYVTPNSTSHRDNLLKTVYANVTQAGDYNFAVGMLDQHNLLVNDTTFKLTLAAGYNVVDVEDKQINVPNGSQLFMDLSSIGTVLKPTDINQKVVPVLVRDNAHESTATGYPGQIFYDTPDYMLPFAYDLIEQGQQQQIAKLEKNVSEVSRAVSGLASKGNELFLVKPNGDKAVLGANDTGLFATNVVPKKVTILGNSLTRERGEIGMAASDQNHDWYHLVSDYILTKNPTAVIKPRYNVSSWESATTSTDRQTYFDNIISPLIDVDTDLVIIQLVDNVNTDEKLATFGEDAKTLITNIRTKAPHTRVFWVAGWFVDDNKINLIKTACLARGALFVDITAYKNDAQYKGTMGATRTGIDGTTWTVTNPGEALHPGDLGMQKIAEAVEESLNF